ncbi:MAG TPA: alanine racemase [Methyloversatilis sp.]
MNVREAAYFGGHDIEDLAQRAGATPFFALDGEAVCRRIRDLRSVLPTRTLLCYAIKANPLPALLERMRTWVDGADVSSIGEIERALSVGFTGTQLGLTGPGKTDAALALAVRTGVRICAESAGEIARIADAAEREGRAARVALRINPDFPVAGTRVRMNGDSVFGIDCQQISAALQALRARQLEFGGLHYHCASRMLQADTINALHAHCTAHALQTTETAGLALPWLNLGGGFGIPVVEGEAALDIASVGCHLHALDESLRALHPDGRIALEPGRYLVGEAGIYVCSIVERKTVRERVWLVVDGGTHHHLHATLQPDRAQPANLPMQLVQRTPADDRECVSIAGPLCAPFDVLARDLVMPRAQPGDLLVVRQSGAYGASASPAAFLGHPPAAELLL